MHVEIIEGTARLFANYADVARAPRYPPNRPFSRQLRTVNALAEQC